jgi:transposase
MQVFNVPRTDTGIEALTARLLELKPTYVALEATGGLERIVVASLASAGLPVVLINPAQVRDFAKSLGKRAKTDSIDAAVIAHFVEATKPELRPSPDEATRNLADLVTRRRQIVDLIGMESQREKGAHGRAKESIARVIASLKKELNEIDSDIDDSVKGSPIWLADQKLLVSVPGIGNTTARILLAHLPELGTIDGRKIASLAGLAPFTKQSGAWRGKSRIAGGRTVIRCAMFVVALTAMRRNPVLSKAYNALVEKGKPKMVALIAIARRLLVMLNAIMRDRKPWQPQSA